MTPSPRRFDRGWALIALCVGIVAYLALVPLGVLLWQSFFTPQSAGSAAQFTLGNYATAYASRETALLLRNSLCFAAGTAVFSLAVGTGLAWMNERTNAPFKSLFFALAIVPLVIPGILFTVAWILLASPRIGLVNLAAKAWLGIDAPFDIYSMAGMIWVDGLHYSPMAFLLMSATFRSMDPSLEESAMMSGASTWQVARRITLRLAWPAIFAALLILFVRSIESFEVPALLGTPAGIPVFTSAIYQAVHRYPSELGLASAYSVALLVLAAAGLFYQSRLAGNGERHATVTGKGFRPRLIDLGPWRWLAAALFITYFLLVVALPFAILLWSSLQKFYSVPSLQAAQNLTLDPYRFILAHPNFLRSVGNSVLLAFGSATLVMLLTAVISWAVLKSRLPGRRLLDNVASLPMVFPGVVLGLALMVFHLHVDMGLYGTLWILMIAYVTRFMPYGLRYNSASMLQLHRELEESAQVSGASWATIFRRVVLPLIRPGLVAGWIYVFIVSVRELSSSILLYSPGSEVVSVVIWELWENGQYVELSALGVMFMTALFVLVMVARWAGTKFAVAA
ncbi:MAG: iron ABC transporter permease [Usitatibacter sp.]